MNDKCPICNCAAIFRVRCFYSQSECENRHIWFYCPTDGKRIIGEAPDIYEGKCHCYLDNDKKDKALIELIKLGGFVKVQNVL